MKKVLILTYYWPPSGGAGVQRWLKFTKYLSEFDVEPFVLTVDPQYASYPQKDTSLIKDISPNTKIYYTKTFELYNLYKLFFRKKEIPYGGFANEANPSFIQKLVRMVRSHLLIPDPRKGWNNYAIRKATELIKKYNIDTVITTSPPHSTQLIGLRLKNKLGIRWISDLRDPWTDIFYYKSLYHSLISSSIDRFYEKKVLSNSDAIITVSQALKQIFKSKIEKTSKNKFYVIPNGFDIEDFQQSYHSDNQEFIISYTGTLSEEYKIDTFFKVLVELIQEGLKIKIRFVGKVTEFLTEKINLAKLSGNIEIRGYVPHDQSIKCLLESNALLLIIPDVAKNKGILTGKLFEYIGSERSIIGIGPIDGDAASIIKETKSGKMFDYDDFSGLKQTIYELYKAFIERKVTKPINIMKYSRLELTRKLAEII